MSGNVAENWSYFREQWNDHEIATGLRENDEKIRVAILRGIMGKDCYNIYKRLALEEEKERLQAFSTAWRNISSQQ